MSRADGLLIMISAASGTGKTSLVAGLTSADPNVVVSVSHTTRPKRPKEKDGVDYNFVPQTQFDAMVENDEFLEHAKVFGHHYGTSAATVHAERAKGRDIVLEIDWQGASRIREVVPDAISVFVLPPSRATLEERLVKRGQDAPNIIESRLSEAQEEMSHYLDFGYLLVNDDFAQALTELQAVVRAERLKSPRASQVHRELVRDLLS